MNPNVKVLTSAKQITYPEKWASYSVEVVCTKLTSNGNQESRVPAKFECVVANTDEKLTVITWQYDLLVQVNDSISNNKVYNMIFDAGYFSKKEKSIRAKQLLATDRTKTTVITEETKPGYDSVDVADLKGKIKALIDKYVVSPNYRKLLSTLLGEKFYNNSAAKYIHHGFKHGLLLHTYSVAYQSLCIAKTVANRYQVDTNVLITGALLHDIGKILELDENCQYTLTGQMVSHIGLGLQLLTEACIINNIDYRDIEIVKISHIIASHHGKLEYGATNVPATIEANIISLADKSDATIENIIERLWDAESGVPTDYQKSLGTSLIKF